MSSYLNHFKKRGSIQLGNKINRQKTVFNHFSVTAPNKNQLRTLDYIKELFLARLQFAENAQASALLTQILLPAGGKQ